MFDKEASRRVKVGVAGNLGAHIYFWAFLKPFIR